MRLGHSVSILLIGVFLTLSPVRWFLGLTYVFMGESRIFIDRRKVGSAQESDNLPERLAFSESWRLASLRG